MSICVSCSDDRDKSSPAIRKAIICKSPQKTLIKDTIKKIRLKEATSTFPLLRINAVAMATAIFAHKEDKLANAAAGFSERITAHKLINKKNN